MNAKPQAAEAGVSVSTARKPDEVMPSANLIDRGRPPLVLSWSEPAHPLPVLAIRSPARSRPSSCNGESPPWLTSGPADRPFDFCGHIERLCADMVTRCESLWHIDVSRLLFAVTQARSGKKNGL